MKKKYLVLASLLAGSVSFQSALAQLQSLDGSSDVVSSSAGDQLFEVKEFSKGLDANSLASVMNEDASVTSMKSISVNSQMLNGSKQEIYVNLGLGSDIPLELSKSYWINSQYQAWTGQVDVAGSNFKAATGKNSNRAVFVNNKGRVFGQINVGGRIFEIMTAEDGQQLLVERDFGQLGTEDDTPEFEGPAATSLKNITNQVVNKAFAVSTIRVLQVTSTTALNRFGANAIVDRMNFFLAQANDVYASNGLEINLQDAGKFSSGVAERSTVSSSINGLVNLNDGYLDGTVTTTRNNQGADIVAHITDHTGDNLCGQASSIGSGQGNAFFVSRHVCTNFTFVHELGHLFGARHDNDPTRTPFAFGHGFVNRGANFRTVMAVNSNPQPRIGTFSTDDQTRNGASLGNATVADNERVHDIRRDVMASFR